MPKTARGLADLARLREQLAEQERARAREAAERAEREAHERARAAEFQDAMQALGGITPVTPPDRARHPSTPPEPRARQRERDDAAVLHESVSDAFEIDTVLHADDALSWTRPGIGADVLRRLRRGEWVVQASLDLHGHRVDGAREELVIFLREALKGGLRCVRVIHGKGLGSKDRQPVLKGKVRNWLTQREEIIAFCQARPNDGGAGALVVLLKPQSR